MTLECLQLLSMLVEEGPPDDPIERLTVKGMPAIGLYDLERAHQRRAALISRFNLEEVIRQLDELMARSGMLPHLRAGMWSLYWMIHEPIETMVSGLIEEAQTWAKGSMVPEEFWTRWLGGAWPLLAFAVKRQLKGDHQAVMRLQPYLRSSEEIAINIQVRAAVRALAERSSQEEWAEFLMSFGTENVSTLPELTPVAGRMGITVGELIQMHLRYWMDGERVKYSYTQLHRIFSAMERCSAQPPDTWHGFWFVAEAKWSLNAEGLARAKQFLRELIDRLPQTHEAIQVIAVVFIKLLALDQATLQLASQVLTVIGSLPHGKSKTLPWRLALSLVDVPLRRLAKLAEFTGHKDEIVRRGALILWEGLIDVILADKEHLYFPGDASKWQRIRSLRLDWRRGLSLISDADNTKRRQGITLLSLSHFPVTDMGRRAELLTAMAEAQAEDEVEAWGRLLQEIPIPKPEEMAWRDVLESVLAQPRTYSSTILTAAMERYAVLTGAVGSGIMEDEVSLGLPTVVA
jgi:hypothetical protein